MADLWNIFAVIFLLIENIRPEISLLEDFLVDPPLTKALGFAIRKQFDKTLEDARLNQEYMHQYHKVLKASQESLEDFAGQDHEERRLRRVIGDYNHEVGVLDRRGNAPRFNSPRYNSAIGRRRARTQALRRQKLNSQSLKSHLEHSKQTTSDYSSLTD